MVGFIFGGNTGLSYQDLQDRRERADLLAKQIMGQQPKTVAQGIGALLTGAAAGIGRYQANKGLKEGQQQASSQFNDLFSRITGQQPSGSAGNIGMPGAASEMAATSPADVSRNGSTFSPFIDTVKAGGLTNPYGLAAVAATGRAESGFSPENAARSWSDPSQSGQAGTAGGVMSWRADRLRNLQQYAASKGEQGNGSPQTQAEFFMREDPQLVAKLNNAKSTEEAQALMNNAWKFAGYNQAGGEAGRRQSYAAGYLPQFQGQGGPQVASLDPSSGMSGAAAIERQAPGSGYVDPTVSAPNYQPQPQQPQPQQMPQSGAQPFDAARFGGPIPTGMQMAQNGQQQPGGPLPALPRSNVGAAPPAAAMQPQQAAMPQQAPQQTNPFAGIDPQVLSLMNNPFLPPEQRQMLQMVVQQQMQANDPMRQLQMQKLQQDLDAGHYVNAGKGTLFNTKTGEWTNAPANPNAPPSDLGLNPQYGVDQQGNPVILQLGKNGKVVQSQMPAGVQLSKEPIKLDAGTQWVLLDPITRQPVGTVPKDKQGEADQTATGKAHAEARAAFPQVEAAANQMISSIDSLAEDPYLDSMVGSVQGRWLPNVSSDAARVQSKMDQIGGQSFLQAFNSLRGAGQITEQEGSKATAAMGRLNTAQSEADYRAALGELRSVVIGALDRARRTASGGAPSAAAPKAGPVSIGGYTIEAE